MHQCNRIFAIFLLIVCFCSCELLDKSDPRKLTLINNTDRNVIFYFSLVRDSIGVDLTNIGNRDELKPVNGNESVNY